MNKTLTATLVTSSKRAFGAYVLTVMLILIVGLGYRSQPLEAQQAFTTTTLGAAITTPVTNPGSDIPATTIRLASGTGVTTTTLIYIDRELFKVTSIANSPTFTVTRGYNGSIMSSHANAAPVKIGQPSWFGSSDKSGSCTATAERALPYINVNNGAQFACTNSVWVRSPFFLGCGTVAACVPAQESGTVKIVRGTVALASASPSVATVTGIAPAFTSSTSYVCSAVPVGTTAAIAAAGVAVSNTDGTSFVLTGPNTVTTVINYICIGT